MNERIEITTQKENVLLRELRLDDASAYFESVEANRMHLSQFNDKTSSKYPTLLSVERSILIPENPDKLRLGIWDTDDFVGSINLIPEEDKAEIGYWIDRRFTGCGYATIAIRALSNFAAKRFSNIYTEVKVDNEASAKVLERAGFNKTSENHRFLTYTFEDRSK